MAFGKRRAAVAAVVVVCGAMALVPFVSAQTLDRDLWYDVFRAFGAGSEIGVAVRELSNDEVSKGGLERARGVYVQSVREGSPAAHADIRSGDLRSESTPSGSTSGAGLSSGRRQERSKVSDHVD